MDEKLRNVKPLYKLIVLLLLIGPLSWGIAIADWMVNDFFKLPNLSSWFAKEYKKNKNG